MPKAISADGTQLDYDESGSGPTVVLINAGPTDRNSSAELAGLLSGSCRGINYDRRGRGGSGDTAPYSVDREGEDLEAGAPGGRGGGAPVRRSRGAVPPV